MSDEKEKKTGTPEFSLEEILAEYGGIRKERPADAPLPPAPPAGHTPPRRAPREAPAEEKRKRPARERAEKRPERPAEPPGEEVPRERSEKTAPAESAGRADNVVAFPGAHRIEAEEPAPAPVKTPREETGAADTADNVVTFPGAQEETTLFAAGIESLRRKADDYADHMFENAGMEQDPEVRRAEKYLPGVDVEEEPDGEDAVRPARPSRRLPPPDTPAKELSAKYGKGLRGLRVRTVLVFLLGLAGVFLTVWPDLPLPMPELLAPRQMRVWVSAALLVLAMLLGIDEIARGLARALRLRPGYDTLLSLSCAATLFDALTTEQLNPRAGHLPCCAVNILALALAMWGSACKRSGSRTACHTAAAAQEPYLVTLDDGKWNARSAYAKASGECAGFGSQMQEDDGAQRLFRRSGAVEGCACVLFSLLASLGRRDPGALPWCLSMTFTAAATFSSTLCYGLPWRSISRRLAKCGAALAGWDGTSDRQAGVLLTDTDLFPPGAVKLNGIKIFGSFSVEKVVGCTASLIELSGSGLGRIFEDLLRAQGAIKRRAENFRRHEGGLSADVRGEEVLVGSAGFMQFKEIALPQGLGVKNAVFCAIDGELAGIFALSYTLHAATRPALTALIRNRLGPVLCTRDFNLNPAMLRQRFKLPVEHVEFPAVERRTELSDPGQSHSETLSAVLCREGILPFSEAVVAARRLHRTVRASAVLTCIGSVVGLLLAFYLTFQQAWSSLTPMSLLLFLGMWLVPTLLISGDVGRY